MSDEGYVIDLIPDELSLARSQLASGLASIAESTLRRRIAEIDVEGGSRDELDAAQALLAEALWRQGRPRAAGAALDGLRPSSIERQRPLIGIIAAEAAAASGDPDGAARAAERVVSSVGVDEAWRIRGGVPGRVAWPVPPSMRPGTRRPAVAPFTAPIPADEPERTAAAHARLEAARQAYGAGEEGRGDRELMLALRLDARLAPEGIGLLEPALGAEPSAERLLLYGDLLRAAGRTADAAAAYDRAARA
ncbi:MAG TPA: hypothetical protein VFM19_05135 [Candidatus Limnocylindria bacterium]|nr:hypothetical protein [Candidatus Limnocylindria bacterium]